MTGPVTSVCTYTAPCPSCGQAITWTSVHRRVVLDVSLVAQDITEADPGRCTYCDTADVRDQLNDSLNRETA